MSKAQGFYKEEREKLEKKFIAKQKAAANNALATLKLSTKLAYLHEFTNDILKASELFTQCYNILGYMSASFEQLFGIWEVKSCADCVAFKMVKVMLAVGDFQRALDLFRMHYGSFKLLAKKCSAEFEYMVMLKLTVGV